MNAPVAAVQTERILGVDFFTGPLAEACARGRRGALVLAPSGPGLAWDLPRDPFYRAALEQADVVLTDSSYLVLAWWLKTGRRIPRHSGLACLRCFLGHPGPRPAVFWVMPSADTWRRSAAWLRRAGWPADEQDGYVAPHYGAGALRDERLAERIEARRPDVVMIAIGGGTQERLAHGLRAMLGYRPGIFCLGAAIAFLAGAQVAIPPWVDRWRLGWLWRTVSSPRRYGPRYVRALRLGGMVLRHGADAPVES